MINLWDLKGVTFRSLVKQTTTRNLYITTYIYFLDGRLCEVVAVRKGIRIVRRWGLNSSMLGDDGRDNAHSVTTREVSWTAGSFFFTAFCSIRRPYITFKLPRGDMDTTPRLRNFFRYLAIAMCHFRYLWNGPVWSSSSGSHVTLFRCITCHSLPVHHMSLSCPILSAEHSLRDFFRLLTTGMCHFRYLRNGRCDRHRAFCWGVLHIPQTLSIEFCH